MATRRGRHKISAIFNPAVDEIGDVYYIVRFTGYQKRKDMIFMPRDRLLKDVPKMVTQFEKRNNVKYKKYRGGRIYEVDFTENRETMRANVPTYEESRDANPQAYMQNGGLNMDAFVKAEQYRLVKGRRKRTPRRNPTTRNQARTNNTPIGVRRSARLRNR